LRRYASSEARRWPDEYFGLKSDRRSLGLGTYQDSGLIGGTATADEAGRETLIAAEATGRVCRGVELDPLYVDVIIRRYEAATGDPAVWSRPEKPSRRWALVGEERQHRRRRAFDTKALQESGGAVKAACAPHRDGHRFESPQLHQEVGASRPGFV
jgi:hypothetical protein